ncbi:hypothetical protein [Paracidovorax oryzae]|uniref:hypothetical protein n=1 Tax=Paracidovorax oryzae TaxID=862720 RepID=UPI00055F8C4B|nr:hypothetical protein [Paracidovorax oryzae]
MPSRTLSNNDIASFTDLYQKVAGPGSVTSAVIAGHLTIEFLLRKLVSQYDTKLQSLADDLNHARLVALNREIGTISASQAAVLLQINQLRNKLAHQISYVPSIAELKVIFDAAAAAFTDLTDGIEQGQGELKKATAVEELEQWVLPELFIQVSYDLHHEYVDRGGDEELF